MDLDDIVADVLAAADLPADARASAEASHVVGDDRFALLEAVTFARNALPTAVLDAIDGYLADGGIFGADDSNLDDSLNQRLAAMRRGDVRAA